MPFTFTEVLRVTDLKRERVRDWIKHGYVKPSIQKSSIQGERNQFSRLDIYKISLFKRLLEVGIFRETASALLKNLTGLHQRVPDNMDLHLCVALNLMPGGRETNSSLHLVGDDLRSSEKFYMEIRAHVADKVDYIFIMNISKFLREVDIKLQELEE